MLMKFTKYLLGILFYLFLSHSSAFGQFNQSNYEEALQKAKNEEKMMLLFVTADWCGPCRFYKNLFTEDEEVKNILEEKYVLISCDFDIKEGKKLKRKFPIYQSGIPKLSVITSEEKLVATFYRVIKKMPGDNLRDKFYSFLVTYSDPNFKKKKK
ncbi:thioredoxin family protein [Marinilabiliaceae bacterium JC017]|nr:thioredoxin family protein [Marinilabiliaceae bacterium JC017]